MLVVALATAVTVITDESVQVMFCVNGLTVALGAAVLCVTANVWLATQPEALVPVTDHVPIFDDENVPVGPLCGDDTPLVHA